MRNASFPCLLLAAAAALSLCGNSARAEDPVPTALDVAEAQDYLGLWQISFEVLGMKLDMVLNIVDLDGKVGVTLDSAQQSEALAIPAVALKDAGIEMSGVLNFGPSITLDISIFVENVRGELVGRIKDKGGIFDVELVGVPASQEQLDSVQGRRPDPTDTRLTIDGRRIRVAFSALSVESSDWGLLEALEDGDVFEFTTGGAHKLSTELDLAFGEVLIEEGNVAPDYPGVYSLWLKRSGDGWSLVFNDQPDVWGTRHLAAHDIAEIPLAHSEIDGDAQEKFLCTLGRQFGVGVLTMRWGAHEWKAAFKALP